MADNPKAFKHWIGPALLARLAAELERAQPGVSAVPILRLAPKLEALELKDRVRLVRDTLRELLPANYRKALPVLLKVSRSGSLKGFDLWPLTEYVQAYGLDDIDLSMKALQDLTGRFTAEFAVRPYLKVAPSRTFEILRRWAADPDPSVRRCASEGTRPRLPWGERVCCLIEDPGPGLEILEALRFDPEAYVRRSVANHLNDVAKDHPDLVIATLRRWRRECPPAEASNLNWIVRQALRGLIKAGHPGALSLIGVDSRAQVRVGHFELDRPRLRVGESLAFTFAIESTADRAQRLVVDYAIHFVRADGRHAAKVFKLKTFELPARGRVTLSKRHSLRPITTRVYYPGKHRVAVQVNGTVMLEKVWTLDVR